MSWLQQNFNQQATYWEKTGKTDSGDPSFATPRQIDVRWEDRSVVFTNPSGEEAVSMSIVFLPEDVEVGDVIKLGVDATTDPLTVIGAEEIQGFSKIPQLKGGDFERRAFLTGKTVR